MQLRNKKGYTRLISSIWIDKLNLYNNRKRIEARLILLYLVNDDWYGKGYSGVGVRNLLKR